MRTAGHTKFLPLRVRAKDRVEARRLSPRAVAFIPVLSAVPKKGLSTWSMVVSRTPSLEGVEYHEGLPLATAKTRRRLFSRTGKRVRRHV